MRKNFGPKPYLYPQPVLIIATYGDDGTPDAMNAAWGGISDSNRVAMYLSAGHKTVQNILSRKAFTVSMADEDHVVECDYVGIVSANQAPDKLARAGLHTTRSQSRLSGPGREGGPRFPGWKKAKVSSPGGVWGPFWSGRPISAAGTPG